MYCFDFRVKYDQDVFLTGFMKCIKIITSISKVSIKCEGSYYSLCLNKTHFILSHTLFKTRSYRT